MQQQCFGGNIVPGCQQYISLSMKIFASVVSNRRVASSISEGDIFIYLCSAQLTFFKIDLISKEFNCAEQEYMNMSPSLIELATPLPSMWYVRTERSILKTKIQPMAIAYCWFIKVRLLKSKKTNISPTIASNIPTAVRIANQTRRTVPVRIATAFTDSVHCHWQCISYPDCYFALIYHTNQTRRSKAESIILYRHSALSCTLTDTK